MIINTYIERFKYLILSLFVFLGAILIETNIFEQRFSRNDVNNFQQVFTKKDLLADELLKDFSDAYLQNPTFYNAYEFYEDNERLLNSRGISLYVYKDDALDFWSSNDYYVNELYYFDPAEHKVVYADHSWLLINKLDTAGYSFIALSLIKHEYAYENDLLTNGFHNDFSLAPNIKLSVKSSLDSYTIIDSKGNYALSLAPFAVRERHNTQRDISISLYFFGVLLLLFFLNNFLRKLKKRFYVDLFNLLFLLFIIGIRYVMIELKIPYVFQSTALFDPQYYASSAFLPSLGDLLINALFLVYFTYQISTRFKESPPFARKISKILNFYGSSLVVVFSFLLNAYIFKTLLFDSNISFVAFKILDLGFLSFIGFLILALLYGGFIFLLDATVDVISKYWSFRVSLLFFLPVVLLLLICGYLLQFEGIEIMAGVFLALFFFVALVRIKLNGEYRLSMKVLLIAIVSGFLMYFINLYYTADQNELKKYYAINLADEQDAVAELLLSDIEEKMMADTTLKKYMAQPINLDDVIRKYLHNKYFSGFFTKYNLEITICSNSPQFSAENQATNCQQYFNNILNEFGVKLKKSNFYFLNNQNGSISYFMPAKYKNSNAPDTYLYIELNSKLVSEELGYPELLLEKKHKENELFSGFSYAKYKNSLLASQKGDYTYGINDEALPPVDNEYGHYEEGGYEHIVYNINEKTRIVVSSQSISYYDSLISFSYIFVFLFLLTVFTEAVSFFPVRFKAFNFRAKIQVSIISVLLISVFVVGGSMVYLNIQQYQESQDGHITEKVQSVLVELEHKFGRVANLRDTSIDAVYEKVVKFSQVFYSDINIYELSGDLLTTSRPEVFELGLLGTQMNPKAYEEIVINNRPRFLHKEQIGNQEFVSAYAILKNKNNKPLAIINLPYFTKQSVLTKRVSVLVVAIVNVYVLLFLLSTVIAVFIAEKITEPLQILKQRFQNIKIGGDNKRIVWKSNDEIGGLIKDYNRMVDELEESANKLAETERQSAWHKMARQIAHEIKNPLTPMKLNIQFLNRAWDAKSEDFGERLKKISASLIEQIDSLADTANEFSNFSKLQETEPDAININELLSNCVRLFRNNSSNTEMTSDIDLCDNCFVWGDKDRLLRVFNNLLKNAIQAIPKDKTGKVHTSIEEFNDHFIIKITDNGKGIEDELKEKLFEPDFTTKSHGMGLGLAISRQIVKNMNGEIWMQSREGEGSTFFIKLPRHVQ